MRKPILVAVCLFLVLCLSGCAVLSNDDNPKLDFHDKSVYDKGKQNDDGAVADEDSFIFTWLSYMEIAVKDSTAEKQDYEKYIDGLFSNMKKINVTDCFVHVSPFADAMYDSAVFPKSIYAEKAEDFDPFSVIIQKGKEYSVDIHAWINPYRVSAKDEIEILPEKSEARRWYEEAPEEDVIISSGQIYFNPCSLKAQKLILDSVKELMENYDIKGIHIDDYFYPPSFGSADKAQYEKYKSDGGEMSLGNWRRENVSNLLRSIYLKVKSYGEDKMFSVSPSGDIEKNYKEYFADVYSWCSCEGYCDMILPQIYYGFENESLPFSSCLADWIEITDKSKVGLVPGLALYKVGETDSFAGKSGEKEWQENSDILMRQVKHLKQLGCKSFALYSGSYINFSETFLSKELNNLKSML